MEYRVTWTIDIDECDSPHEAAEKALDVQRTAGSIATEFEVRQRLGINTFGEPVTVDFYAENSGR